MIANRRQKVAGGSSVSFQVECVWNLIAHGDAREGKWRGNWRMEWVASTLHITSEHGVSSITNADTRTSAASSRLDWYPCRFKWTRPFRRMTKSGFCACASTFQPHYTVMAENAVSQRYVVEKQRRNLIAILCKFGYSFFIFIQNFELLVELTLRLPD